MANRKWHTIKELLEYKARSPKSGQESSLPNQGVQPFPCGVGRAPEQPEAAKWKSQASASEWRMDFCRILGIPEVWARLAGVTPQGRLRCVRWEGWWSFQIRAMMESKRKGAGAETEKWASDTFPECACWGRGEGAKLRARMTEWLAVAWTRAGNSWVTVWGRRGWWLQSDVLSAVQWSRT